MSPPEKRAPSLDPPAFARLPRNDQGPVFAEPWQAQAFALAVRLSEQGCFTWHEWAETLGAQFNAAAGRGEPDDGSHYYEHWLAALEKLVTATDISCASGIACRRRPCGGGSRRR